jgi:hypothetical protein
MAGVIRTPLFFPKDRPDTTGYKSALSRIPDSELTKDEKRVILRSREMRHLLFSTRAVLRYNRAAEFDGAVALSLHFVGFFYRKDATEDYQKNAIVHLFDIGSIRVKNEQKLLLFCRMSATIDSQSPVVNCRIICRDAVGLGQVLYRNYMVSTVAFPRERTCDFRTNLPDRFPVFRPGLSPSQGYQFTYFAFCTRLQREYIHDVTRYYHEHLRFHDGVFDIGQLQCQMGGRQANLDDLWPAIYAMEAAPYPTEVPGGASALGGFPFVHAICCHNIPFHKIGRVCERIVKSSKVLRFIHLVNCQIAATNQLAPIGRALQDNPTIPIAYYNFQDNYSIGGEAFWMCQALAVVTHPVFYLSFANCGIPSVEQLLNSVSMNAKAFSSLKYFYFNGNGAQSGRDHAARFVSYLEERAANPENPILRLGIGGDDECQSVILASLLDHPHPRIEELSFAHTTVGRAGAGGLMRYARYTETLQTLDLTGCGIEPEYVQHVLRAMVENEKISDLRVRLNSLNLAQHHVLLSVTKGFLYGTVDDTFNRLDKWHTIELAGNSLGTFELEFLVALFWRMRNLQELDLGHNFTQSAGVGMTLATLLNLPALKKLRIAGDGSRYLGKEALPFLDALIASGRNFEELDISGNQIGDAGVLKVIELCEKCDAMESLMLDDNNIASLRTFERIVELAQNRPKLIYFQFPYYDTLRYLLNHQKDRARIRQLRAEFDTCINGRRAQAGMSIMMPFRAVPELAELVEQISGEDGSMDEALEAVRSTLAIHGGITKDLGVTLPYLDMNQPFEQGGTEIIPVDVPGQAEYHAENINFRINEDTYDPDAVDFAVPPVLDSDPGFAPLPDDPVPPWNARPDDDGHKHRHPKNGRADPPAPPPEPDTGHSRKSGKHHHEPPPPDPEPAKSGGHHHKKH